MQAKAIEHVTVENICKKIKSGKLSQKISETRGFTNVLKQFSKSNVDIMVEPLISSIVYGMQLC